ncbi:MAG: glycosyltransferase family 4 protein [Planctomycetota bacterium]
MTTPPKRLRALLIAEACDPDGASVPLEGWSHASALREVVDAHILTHPRNRDAVAARGLVEGVDFTLIDNEHVARPLYKLANALRGGAGKGWTTVTALTWPSYWEFERLVWRQFGAAIRAGAYDVVHRITPLSPTIPSRLASRCRAAGVPFVLGPLNGGVPWPRGYDGRRRAEKEWLSYVRGAYRLLPGYRSTLRDASAFVIGSQDTFALTDARGHDRCVYIPENGVEPGRFHKRRSRRAASPLRCVFLGRLVPYKGADLLLEACAEFLRAGTLELKIVGEGPQRSALEARIRELGLGDRVQLCGWVQHEKVQDVLSESDFLALPSIREFGGGVVLEAMALGLPAVVVGYGGPAELVTDATGVRVPIGEPAAVTAGFRDAIARLLAQPSLVDAMGEAAARRVHEQFAWPVKARQTLEVYRWVTGQRDKPDFGMPLPDLPGAEPVHVLPARPPRPRAAASGERVGQR